MTRLEPKGKVMGQAFMDEINKIFAPLMPRMPNYRYWTIPKDWKKTRYVFGWTTQRDRKGKFYAFKYRELKNGDWTLIKKVAFGRRRIAKARSSKWHDKYYGDKTT